MTATVTLEGSTAAPSVPARGDLVAGTVGFTVCLLPFLVPAGPGNTSPADVAMVAAIVAAALWVTHDRLPGKLPYLPGVTGLVLGGILAAAIAGAPLYAVVSLAQDVLLFFWAATLALGRHNLAILAAATRAWCRVAPTYSLVVVVAYVIGFNALSGVSEKDGTRASYTFGDPNLAANYLVVSLFMMAACKHPRSPGVRRIGYCFVLVALAFTGSNGAFLTLAIGSVLCVAVSRYRAQGAVAGSFALAASALAAALLLVLVLPRVDLDEVRSQAGGSVPLLRDSIGRSDGSSQERSTIVNEGYRLYLQGDATGFGPARTKATLAATQAPYVKEAHNDYLATLLERGVIGAIGLLLLGAAVFTRCLWLLTRTLPAAYAEVVPRAWLLIVIAPVMAASAGFYEVLHFRHMWTWLGIIAALALAIQDRPRQDLPRQDQ